MDECKHYKIVISDHIDLSNTCCYTLISVLLSLLDFHGKRIQCSLQYVEYSLHINIMALTDISESVTIRSQNEKMGYQHFSIRWSKKLILISRGRKNYSFVLCYIFSFIMAWTAKHQKFKYYSWNAIFFPTVLEQTGKDALMSQNCVFSDFICDWENRKRTVFIEPWELFNK